MSWAFISCDTFSSDDFDGTGEGQPVVDPVSSVVTEDRFCKDQVDDSLIIQDWCTSNASYQDTWDSESCQVLTPQDWTQKQTPDGLVYCYTCRYECG